LEDKNTLLQVYRIQPLNPIALFLLLLYDDFGLVNCRSQSWNLSEGKTTEEARLLEAAKDLGLEVFGFENSPARLGQNRMAIKKRERPG
jgi:hypothetical protein